MDCTRLLFASSRHCCKRLCIHAQRRSVSQLTPTWEVSPKIRQKASLLRLDLDGFASCWKNHPVLFDDKQKQHEYYLKNRDNRRDHEQRKTDHMLLKGKLKATKSNIRKVRKTKAKELEVEEISADDAAEYLQILQRIRDGATEPKKKKMCKHLPDVTVNKSKIKQYLRRIKKLNIISVNDIQKRSQLPSKQTVDGWYTELNKMYDEICQINKSSDPEIENTLLHLTLFEQLLLSFGKIGRIHKMLTIYDYLKSVNLHISNATLIEMMQLVQDNPVTCKQLYSTYLNDFRKGKIAERPTLQLFNTFIAAQAHSSVVAFYDISVLFKMMTEEFKMKPDDTTILSVLQSFSKNSPPRYKSAQRLMKRMTSDFGMRASADHYAEMLSIIATSWRNFSKSYVEFEEVSHSDLKHYQHGVDIKRCMKVFHTILQQRDIEVKSKIFSSIFKACINAKSLKMVAKRDLINAIFQKYILLSDNGLQQDGIYQNVILDERFPEISDMKLESDICTELIRLCYFSKDYEQARAHYNVLTTHEKVRNRFQVDCDLFVALINIISCDQRLQRLEMNDEEYERLVMQRIEWTEAEIEKHDILPNNKIWYEWLMLAKRLNLPTVTDRILQRMDAFMNEVQYFEFNVDLLQAVVEALYANNEMEKALAFYGKYYGEIELFSHWHLKVTGQKEIDFHGFRAGFACVALQWILQNEYPPLNISKYLLEKYGNQNPNIHLIIGQGHHNDQGESRLFKKLSAFINALEPTIQASRYPNNPGQLVLNGDDVVRWRKFHGHQVDTLEVNKHLQIKLFI